MTRIFYPEIKPGLVTFLDDHKLREKSDCYSSAYVDETHKHRTIVGPHYFLILEEITEDLWLAAPLSSRFRAYRHLLLQDLKTGYEDQWRNEESFFIEREFWKLSATAICRSSDCDVSPKDDRRYYDFAGVGGLQVLLKWHRQNPHDFLRVTPMDVH